MTMTEIPAHVEHRIAEEVSEQTNVAVTSELVHQYLHGDTVKRAALLLANYEFGIASRVGGALNAQAREYGFEILV